MKKKLLSIVLALILCLSLTAPASAFDMAQVTQANTIAAGYDQTAVIDKNGSLWMWGNNYCGQLGNGGSGNVKVNIESFADDGPGVDYTYTHYYQTIPIKIMDDVVSVSAGGGEEPMADPLTRTAVIKSDGSLWAWGNSMFLGNGGKGNATAPTEFGEKMNIQTVPIKIMDDVASVSVGGYANLAIKTDRSLWTWGFFGYESDSTTYGSSTPVKVMDDVASACAGNICAAAIKTDGSLWMWGGGVWGAFGMGRYILPQTPTKIMDGVASVSIGVASSYTFIAAVKTDGSLWMWGMLGFASGNQVTDTPVKVMDGVAAVSTGESLVAVIKLDKSLWVWGAGLIGDGSTEGSSVPIKVMDKVADVSIGSGYVVAVKTDGSVWTWGNNRYGQLGNGGIGDLTTNYGGIYRDVYQTVPMQVSGLTAKLPTSRVAYARQQNITIDGKAVTFNTYALRDANGNDTNYIKLRDLASQLNNTDAQFNVVWDGATNTINLVSGTAYQIVGSEMKTPFSGNQPYRFSTSTLMVNGKPVDLDAIVLTDSKGGAYTYFKLRDLGKALNFNVSWISGTGIVIDTEETYSDAN